MNERLEGLLFFALFIVDMYIGKYIAYSIFSNVIIRTIMWVVFAFFALIITATIVFIITEIIDNFKNKKS